jgi:hypothetical protein
LNPHNSANLFSHDPPSPPVELVLLPLLLGARIRDCGLGVGVELGIGGATRALEAVAADVDVCVNALGKAP